MSENRIRARVLWFNDAKGYGLVRTEDVLLDDIRVDAAVLDETQELPRDMLVDIVYKETLTGLVVEKLWIVDETTE